MSASLHGLRLAFGFEWVDEFLPRVLPDGWSVIEKRDDGECFRHGYLTVIASGSRELDGRRWLHVSCAHPERLPTWDELKEIKALFIGEDRTALQVLPPTSKYVNIHPNCLHLWHCADGDVTPDFTHGKAML